MATRSIMFQGTGSDVGKSLLVAGLCRLFARQGLRVVPFKAQNMSNNAAVAADGGEIGRAQWLQARAAGVVPSVHMNPVLLKPQSDRRSQVIVRGKVVATMNAHEYQATRQQWMPQIVESYHHLAKHADMVLIEGAGSPAEINLRAGDIANMGFARAIRCPVVLIGDIDRGGVIASMVGTHAVLAEEDRAMIRGFLINKFRGDAALFAQGSAEIARRTGWMNLGLVPYHPALGQLPQEDSLACGKEVPSLTADATAHIVILWTPHIANFDDMDPLRNDPAIRISWCRAGEAIPADARLVIIPGSKSTIADLAFIRLQGWDIDLRAHHRRGGRIIGICGGFQMLGTLLSDPQGIEGDASCVEGLGFLDMTTCFTDSKIVTPWQGKYENCVMHGYEMHCGISQGEDLSRPVFTSDHGPEGARSHDGLIWGSYVHGMFANDDFRRHIVALLGAKPSTYSYTQHMDAILDGWADCIEQSVSIPSLLSLCADIELQHP